MGGGGRGIRRWNGDVLEGCEGRGGEADCGRWSLDAVKDACMAGIVGHPQGRSGISDSTHKQYL